MPKKIGRRNIALICINIMMLAYFVVGSTRASTAADINKKMAQISAKSHCTLGVAAIHIEKKQSLSYNGNMPFAMASTVKLPIAIALLHHVDNKEHNLDHVVKLNTHNLVPGSGNLYQYFRKHILKISLRDLLRHMMTKSDNTATDVVLKEMKGPKAVLTKLQSLGFHHIRVNRTILQLFLATNDVSHVSSKKPAALRKYEKNFNKISLGKKTESWKLFQKDLRDTATASDMALLLASLYQKKLLSSVSTQYLLSLMEECKTGKRRIKGLLPPKVKVAHKTGTWAIYSRKFINYPGAKNLYRFAGDVGIITLPQERGHIAIAVYVKSTSPSNDGRERVIAEVAREIFNYFNNP